MAFKQRSLSGEANTEAQGCWLWSLGQLRRAVPPPLRLTRALGCPCDVEPAKGAMQWGRGVSPGKEAV